MGSPEIVERGEEEGEAVPAVAEKMGSKVIDEGGEEEPSIKVEDPEAMCTKHAEEEAIPAHAQQMESKEIKVEEEEEDDDEGPPPGWQNIIRSPQKPLPSQPPTESMGSKELEEEEGKVETFGDQERKCSREIEGEEVNHAYPEAIEEKEIKLERGRGGEGEGEVVPVHTEAMEIKEEGEDDEDDGPPPGWHSIVPPPSKLSTSLPPTGRTGSKEIEKEREVKVDILGDQVRISKEIKEEETVPAHTEGVENEEAKEGEDDDDDGPPPGWQHIAHLSPGPLPSLQPTEVAQMVCGSCRRLLSYPRGARHVQCSSCQTVNLVLEEHQVGQVKCDSCSILLMYPYGAPSVRCSCCRFVTQIGDHNKRPPWSTQQGRPIPTPHPVQ